MLDDDEENYLNNIIRDPQWDLQVQRLGSDRRPINTAINTVHSWIDQQSHTVRCSWKLYEWME